VRQNNDRVVLRPGIRRSTSRVVGLNSNRLPYSVGLKFMAVWRGDGIVPLIIEVEQEVDGRWIAEVSELPGVVTYAPTRQAAIDAAKALSLRVLADRLEHGDPVPNMGPVFAVTP
jgi:predicted RNase H-like HicB family nuclease